MSLHRLGARLTRLEHDARCVLWTADFWASCVRCFLDLESIERPTFHVEQRWIEAIRRQADLDGFTYTQIVNEAFR